MPTMNGHSGNGRGADSVEKALLGVGWHFPVRVDLRRPDERASLDRGRGGIALARHEDDIEQALRIVLATQPGERRMRPTFGCRIHELVFAPINATTFGYMRRYVEEALTVWEPRIEIHAIDVASSGQDGWVDISLHYRVKVTKDERTLVYPFYMIGEE
jgi:phage baseplate assembly protein W